MSVKRQADIWPGAAIVLIFSLDSCAAVAADASVPLDTVIVVGTTPLPGAELDRNDVAAPVQSATGKDIESSHAVDLTSFMNRMLSSVYVNDVQNNLLQPDVNYRGYTASALLGTAQGLSVYLDGVRLNQPFGDVVSWDLIPRQAISTMTLMPGSNPLFGLNTLGGALALRTRDGFSDPGVSVELNYGSNRRRSALMEIGGHSSAGLYGYATANRLQDDGWRTDSPTDATQAFGKMGWRHTDGDISISGAYAQTNLTGNGMQEQQLLARNFSSVYTQPDDTKNRASLVNLVVTQQLNADIAISGNAYHRAISTHTINGDINTDALGESLYQPDADERAALTAAGYTGFPVSGETQNNTSFPSWRCIADILLNSEPNQRCNGVDNATTTRQSENGIAAQGTLSIPIAGRTNQMTVGAAMIESTAHFVQSSRFGYLAPDRSIITVDGPGASADGSQDSVDAFDARVDLTGTTHTRSLYFTDTLHLIPNLQLTLSARYDRTSIMNRDSISPGGGPGSLDGNHVFSRINPAVGITFAPMSELVVYLGYNEGSRAPSAIELGCSDPANSCRLPNALAGDPPLRQVVTRTYDAGLRGAVGESFSWNAGVFDASNLHDILFVTDDPAGFGYFRNFGATRRRGIELGAKGEWRTLQLSANYTFLDATYRTAEEVAGAGNSSNDAGAGLEGDIRIQPGDRIPLTPRNIFKTAAQWSIAPTCTLNADLVSIGGSYARGNENNEHHADGLYYIGPGSTGGYTVVNLGLEYRPVASLRVFVHADNLFDREYFTASQLGPAAFNAAGRFVAQPFAGSVGSEQPLLYSTFYAPGAPRSYWTGVKYSFGQ
jgi:outer membrane receptor protein involved in Fe transport